jgi:pimeloyl-[acyl-carrier protein] methyl ester esterase
MAIQALGSPSAKKDIKRVKAHVENYPIPAHEALRAGLSILADSDLRKGIAQIKIPTLRLYGRLDSLVPVAAVPLIAELQPNSKSHIFPHASHAPFVSHPNEFIEQLRTFLD